MLRRTQVFSHLLLAGCLPLLAGCASGYLADRGRDALDVVTLTLGVGGGAKARVGPVQVAVIENSDMIGIRAGTAFADALDWHDNDERYVLPFPRRRYKDKSTAWRGIKDADTEWIFGEEKFADGRHTVVARRGKEVDAFSPVYCPVICLGRGAQHWTQIEVAGGIGLTVRLGLNPGELLDFLLGWGAVDLYGDDIEMRKDAGLKYR